MNPALLELVQSLAGYFIYAGHASTQQQATEMAFVNILTNFFQPIAPAATAGVTPAPVVAAPAASQAASVHPIE